MFFPIKDSIKIPRPAFAVYAIILANLIVFLYQRSLFDTDATTFTLKYALIPMRYFDPDWVTAWAIQHQISVGEALRWAAVNNVRSDDYWPFITGTFMHGGWLHIILNMWMLYIFGSSLEGRVGSFAFLIYYLLCGIIASVVHAYLHQSSLATALGASGAIAGVLGGYATTFPRARLTILILVVFIPFFFRMPALAFAGIWFVLQFVQGFLELTSLSPGGGIAIWAHVGGFLAGLALIPFWRLGANRTFDENEPRLEPLTQAVSPSDQWRGPWG